MADSVVSTRVGQDGSVLKLEVAGTSSQEVDVSAFSEVLDFGSLTSSVAEVASAMTDALRRAAPDEGEVTFGIDATIETGKLTSLVVKGGGTATFQVRLLWKKAEPGSTTAPQAGDG
jgi:Trypsin-co-occurring domain 1